MKVLKEYEDKSGGEKVVITVWDNNNVSVEYDGTMIRFDSIYELKSLVNLLNDFVEQEEADEALQE